MIEGGLARQVATFLARSQAGVHAHGVRVFGSNREYPPASAPDDDARGRRGARITAGTAHRVIPPGECRLPFTPQRLHDSEALGQPVHADSRFVELDPGLLVITPEPARSKTHLDPPFGRQAERGDLLGQDHRVAEVVVQHAGPHVEGGGRFGGHGHGYERPELGVKVVRNVQGRVTEILGRAGLVPPSRHGWRDRGVHAESKREHLSSYLHGSDMRS